MRRARRERRLVARQIHRERGDLLGRAEPAERLAADEGLDFAAVARGVGLADAVEVRSETALADALAALCQRAGPGLVSVRLEDEPCPAAPPGPWSQMEERAFFMRALLGPAGAAP